MIDQTDFYHGAALATALGDSRCIDIARWPPGYLVNESVWVLLKYTTKGGSPWQFTFTTEDVARLQHCPDEADRVVMALVCGGDGICTISAGTALELLGRNRSNFADMTRETMIRGQQTEIMIEQSSFPGLFRLFGEKPSLFVEAAWIAAMLELKMSATVERVSRLELTLSGDNLEVVFAGQRRKEYSNRPAFQVEVSGTCRL